MHMCACNGQTKVVVAFGFRSSGGKQQRLLGSVCGGGGDSYEGCNYTMTRSHTKLLKEEITPKERERIPFFHGAGGRRHKKYCSERYVC